MNVIRLSVKLNEFSIHVGTDTLKNLFHKFKVGFLENFLPILRGEHQMGVKQIFGMTG